MKTKETKKRITKKCTLKKDKISGEPAIRHMQNRWFLRIPHSKSLVALALLASCSATLGCWQTRSMREARVLTIGCPACETVVLIHGLNRSSRAMKKMAAALREDDYTVVICDYPSRSATVEVLADNLFNVMKPQLDAAEKVHFVTHSMGGIMLRKWIEKNPLPNLGRVVMLGPPNAGSETVDKLRDYALFQWINGPAGGQLGTPADSLPATLARPSFKPGVIAGDRTINPFLSMMIPGKDDGKVSVERTKVKNMGDFICLHVTHACMMRNRKVIEQTKYFLKNGNFKIRKK